MSLREFEMLTPGEWRATCQSWHKTREQMSRETWYQVRWLGTVTVQPHVRKTLSPRDLLRFPWEDDTKTSAPRMSREEHERRMADAIRRMGKYLDKDGRNNVAAKKTRGAEDGRNSVAAKRTGDAAAEPQPTEKKEE